MVTPDADTDADAPAGQTPRTQASAPATPSSELCPNNVGALSGLSGEIRRISKGDQIRLRASQPEFAVLVLGGLLFRYARTRNGCQQVVALYFPEDWASVEAFLGAPCEGEIAALTGARVRLVYSGAIRRVLDETPGLLRLITIESLFQTRVQAAWLTRNSIMPAIASLAHFLSEVVIRSRVASADGTAHCPFPFSQQMIAETLGLTSVHVNRTLRVLRERGLAEVTHGMLQINNLRDLAAVAEFDPHYLQLRSTLLATAAETRIS